MPPKKDWMKLDNVAKIFPSTSSKKNTGVFRFYCELTEPVSGDILQTAFDKTIKKFPHFLCVMRSGLFWYYLEQTDEKPKVHEENTGVCAPLFNKNKRSLLIDVSYYKNRINFEVFHALTDGTGALQFLKELCYNYIGEKYHSENAEFAKSERYESPMSSKTEDSFIKYYKKDKSEKSKLPRVAYHITGQPSDQYYITEGILSAKELVKIAKEKGTTVTVLLCAVLIMAIKNEMLAYREKKPIVITVPVNLRQYFPSETARNFFGSIRVGYQCTGKDTLEDIVAALSQSFKEELTKEKLSRQISGYMAAERNIFAKIVPLSMKNFFLKLARISSDQGETIVVSNVGKVDMPKEMLAYIKSMGVFASTKKIQSCIVTVGDRLSVGFSSRFYEADIQREFLCELSKLGLEIIVRSNLPEQEES